MHLLTHPPWIPNSSPQLFLHSDQGTKDIHTKLESRVNLETFGASRSNYVGTLQYFLGVWEPLECRLLDAIEYLPDKLSMKERVRSHSIKQDLLQLGLSQEEIDKIPRLESLSPLSSPAETLGAMYVTEGSTLGGQTISKKIAELGIFADSGGAFFHGHGSNTVTLWRKYCAEMESLLSTELEIGMAVAEAERTFKAVYNWFPETTGSASDQTLASV